jgi:hypothetical protein
MVLSSKAVVLFVMVLLVASPVLAQQARGPPYRASQMG